MLLLFNKPSFIKNENQIVTHATYECLCCQYRDVLRGKRKEYQKVTVCPKCKGAFVDTWYIGKYQRDQTDNHLVNKHLVIELDDFNSVPKVFYKGEEIKRKVAINLEWKTRTDGPGKLELNLVHQDCNNGAVREIKERRMI